MHVEHRGLPTGGTRAAQAAPQSGRGTVRCSSPAPLELARPQPDRGHLRSGEDAEGRRPVVPGEFAVRWERRRVTSIMWLSGALNRATATLLDRELDQRPPATIRLIVDLTGLELIDPPGLDALMRVHWRAARRGDRLSFRHGPHVAQLPLELTRTVRLRSRYAAPPAAESDENSYFALAMACVDVDHPRPRVIDLGQPGRAPRPGSRRERRISPLRASLAPRHLRLAVDPR